MKATHFFSSHPVFRHDEFAAFLEALGGRSARTTDSILAYHVRTGRLLRVRRGLYATVPHGFDPGTFPVDPYLLASNRARDAVLAYHSALQFRGKAYSIHHRFPYLTGQVQQAFEFRGQTYVAVPFPKRLRDRKAELSGVETVAHAGGSVRVTNLERSLVDVLARPDLGGGWEEVWRSLELVEFFDLDQVVEYALTLGGATTVAKVGFFLEQHRESLMVEEHYLARLGRHAPRQARYLERSRREPGKLIARWNLIVPPAILEPAWVESP